MAKAMAYDQGGVFQQNLNSSADELIKSRNHKYSNPPMCYANSEPLFSRRVVVVEEGNLLGAELIAIELSGRRVRRSSERFGASDRLSGSFLRDSGHQLFAILLAISFVLAFAIIAGAGWILAIPLAVSVLYCLGLLSYIWVRASKK